MDLGTAAPMAAGWRPDCVQAAEQFVERLPPPKMKEFYPLMVGAASANDWMPSAEQRWIAEKACQEDATLHVEVEPWSVNGVFATVSYFRRPDGRVATQRRFHGKYRGEGAPIYFREVAMACALELVWTHLTGSDTEKQSLRYIEVLAGDGVTCSRLHAWLPWGAWRPQSGAAARIAELCRLLTE